MFVKRKTEFGKLQLFVMLIATLFFVLIPIRFYETNVYASTRTWDGGGTTNNWSDCVNWSSDICPVSIDTVILDATSSKDSVIDIDFSASSVSWLQINSGYTGVVTLNKTFSFTSNGLTQNSGTFDANNQTLSITSFTLSSGTFTATSGTTTISSAVTISGGTFNHNNGTVIFSGASATLSCGNQVFNNVSFTGQTGTKTIQSTCNFPLGNNPIIPNSISLAGTLSGTGTLTMTAGTLSMTGGSISGFTDFSGYQLDIGAGATVDWSSLNSVTLSSIFNSFTMGGSNSSFSGPGTGDLYTGGTFLISSSTATFTAPGGNLTVPKAFTVSGTFNHNNGTVVFSGSTATLSCGNLSTFNIVSFAGQTGTKTINSSCNFPLGNNPTIPNSITLNGTLSGTGTLTMSTSTLTLTDSSDVTGFTSFAGNTISIGLVSSIDWSSFSSVSLSSTFSMSSSGSSFIGPSSGSMTIANFSMSAPNTSFTAPNSGSITVGSFSMTNSTSTFVGPVVGDMTVTSSFTLSSSGTTFNSPGGNLYLSGNVTLDPSTIFNNNSTAVVFSGGVASLTCGGYTFNNASFAGQTGVKTINSFCNLSLGNNPTIPNGINLYGTLTGTGTLTISSGTLTLNSSFSLSGFSSFTGSSMSIGTGTTVDLSSYSFVTLASTFTMSNANCTFIAPSAGDMSVGGSFTMSNTNNSFTAPASGNMTVSGLFNLIGTSSSFTAPASGDMTVTGNFTLYVTFTAPGGDLNLAGNVTIFLSSPATFNHNSGNIVLNGSNQALSLYHSSGTLDFFNFKKATTSEDTLTFSNTGTVPDISGTLELTGTPGNLLKLRGTCNACYWRINSSGSRALSYLDIKGGRNDSATTINLSGTGSIDSGNNINWIFDTTLNLGFDYNVYTVNPWSDQLSLLNAITAEELSSQSITLAGYTVNGSNGLAYNPLTCEMYSVIQLQGQSGRQLVKINPTTGIATSVGNTGKKFAGIAFTRDGVLWGITGKGESNQPSTLYTISTLNGSTTSKLTLGGGDSGETIGYNPVDGLLYHLSGNSSPVFESINPNTLSVTNIPISYIYGLDYGEATSMMYSIPESKFLVSYFTVLHRLPIDGNNVVTGYVLGTNDIKGMVAETCNLPSVSTLGPIDYVSGDFITTSTPTLTFDIADSDFGDTIKYTVQIDTDADFSSPIIEYVSEFGTAGSKSFQVGQPAGSGSYTQGTQGQILSGGTYYWRVKAEDIKGGISEYVTANSGLSAFKILSPQSNLDTTKPVKVVITSIGIITDIPVQDTLLYYFTSTNPRITGKAEAGSKIVFNEGSSSYVVYADSNGDFVITLDSPALALGENILTYYSMDSSDNKSDERTLTLIIGEEFFPENFFGDEVENQDGTGGDTSDDEGGKENPSEDEDTTTGEDKEVSDNGDNGNTVDLTRLQIITPNGKPLKNSQVKINNVVYTTDSNGYIYVENLDPGTYTLEFVLGAKVVKQDIVIGDDSQEKGIVIKIKEDADKGLNINTIVLALVAILLVAVVSFFLFRRRSNLTEV
ncbi:hypothetical protein HYV12_03365 [Candidatus Dojkabacteria bacterium]|nr:hypothetical protein [Candidatus Dojkabacteria bacterium]